VRQPMNRFMRKPVRKFTYIARRDIAQALLTYLRNEEEVEAHTEALVDGLLRGRDVFLARFELTHCH